MKLQLPKTLTVRGPGTGTVLTSPRPSLVNFFYGTKPDRGHPFLIIIRLAASTTTRQGDPWTLDPTTPSLLPHTPVSVRCAALYNLESSCHCPYYLC